ncbi:MAG: hypothetical protein MI919_00325, partial [Holophagales bacterium]|nr:hypothetical protein [Holophagales bacterium]
HHGTRLIKYFYNRAKERSDPDTAAVREEEFRYPGPKPHSKEMGVLMLADAIEAASRTLVAPSRQKIRTVLRAVFDDCLEDGQLDRTDLTLGDLKRVEEAFLRVLVNIHHRRIDYPGFDFNRGAGDTKTGDVPRPTAEAPRSTAAKAAAGRSSEPRPGESKLAGGRPGERQPGEGQSPGVPSGDGRGVDRGRKEGGDRRSGQEDSSIVRIERDIASSG